MILSTPLEYFDYLRYFTKIVPSLQHVYISTYNIGPPLTYGEVYKFLRDLEVRKFQNPNLDVKIMVSRGAGLKGTIGRVREHASMWKDFEWGVVDEVHLKCVLFGHRPSDNRLVLSGHSPGDNRLIDPLIWEGAIGGRNLSGSTWVDVSFWIISTDAELTASIFKETWKKAKIMRRGRGEKKGAKEKKP